MICYREKGWASDNCYSGGAFVRSFLLYVSIPAYCDIYCLGSGSASFIGRRDLYLSSDFATGSCDCDDDCSGVGGILDRALATKHNDVLTLVRFSAKDSLD